jgi:hypothetical protein
VAREPRVRVAAAAGAAAAAAAQLLPPPLLTFKPEAPNKQLGLRTHRIGVQHAFVLLFAALGWFAALSAPGTEAHPTRAGRILKD